MFQGRNVCQNTKTVRKFQRLTRISVFVPGDDDMIVERLQLTWSICDCDWWRGASTDCQKSARTRQYLHCPVLKTRDHTRYRPVIAQSFEQNVRVFLISTPGYSIFMSVSNHALWISQPNSNLCRKMCATPITTPEDLFRTAVQSQEQMNVTHSLYEDVCSGHDSEIGHGHGHSLSRIS